jgi:large subunit ribosomal protein L18
MVEKREFSRIKRHWHIRKKVAGSGQRPRLCVHRSLRNLHAQIIDDASGKTLIFCSTNDKALKKSLAYGGNFKAAEALGKFLAETAKAKGIVKVVFDRGGYLYHGRIKAFAEACRKGGLEF